jgi:hypothetical protein
MRRLRWWKRSTGAHRTVLSSKAKIAAVVTVLGLAGGGGGGAVAVGAASAQPWNPGVDLVGRVCGPHTPPPGHIEYAGSTGDRGSVGTGPGRYVIHLHRVSPRGEWVSGTAYCPAPRPMNHIRAEQFQFFVPRPARGDVYFHDIP